MLAGELEPDGFPFSWATGKFVEHISQYGDGSSGTLQNKRMERRRSNGKTLPS